MNSSLAELVVASAYSALGLFVVGIAAADIEARNQGPATGQVVLRTLGRLVVGACALTLAGVFGGLALVLLAEGRLP